MKQGIEFVFEPISQVREDYFLTGFAPQPLYKASLFKKGILRVYCYFHKTVEGKVISLPEVPFGGIWIIDHVNFELLQEWVAFILIEVSRLNCHSVTFIQPPAAYEPFADAIQYLFFKMGFILENTLNYQILAGKNAIQQYNDFSFGKKMATNPEVRVLTKPLTESKPLENIQHWNQCKGYRPTLSLDRLMIQMAKFPSRYHLISILQEEKAVAHTVAVQLTSSSLFYAYSGFDSQASLKNLGACMLEQLIVLGKDLQVDFIDLGSSDLGHRVNHSLVFFKSKFANSYQNKTVWTKQLNL
jgi:hypothetical protein